MIKTKFPLHSNDFISCHTCCDLIRFNKGAYLSFYVAVHDSFILAVCNPRCQNGKCTAPNVCKCNPGFQGTRCEQGNNFMCFYSVIDCLQSNG